MNELVAALREHRSRLAARVTDEMFEDPFWTERFPKRGRKFSEEDVGYHVEHLVEALLAGDPLVFARYARWLQSVLTTRGMCTRHLAESIERLGRAASGLPGGDALGPYVDAAGEALRYETGPAAELQDVVAGGTYGPHLVSFLADAAWLGRPEVFADYAGWLAGRGVDVSAEVEALPEPARSRARGLL